MEEWETLRQQLNEKIEGLGPCDILIGIPSYNDAKTIGDVVETVFSGLARYFPNAKAILVNSDGGSIDGTPERVSECSKTLPSIQISHGTSHRSKITNPFHGIPERGTAFRVFLETAKKLDVKACAFVDAGLRSMTPEWIDLMLGPILKQGYDYVVCRYQRYKYDGTITKTILYPMTRALYGKQIRQTIGGEFGFSGALVEHFLAKDVWDTDVAQYGIDLWMATTAITRGDRICQANLGPRVKDPKGRVADLSTMLAQVIGSGFSLMEEHVDHWKRVYGSEPVPQVGIQHDSDVKPIPVDVNRMFNAFALGLNEFIPLWEGVVSQKVLAELRELRSSASQPRLTDDLWVRIIYELALAAHQRTMTRDHLLKSFTPLYLGKVASFIQETERSSKEELEEKIESLCRTFEHEKPFLIDHWDRPSNLGEPL